MGHLIQIMEVAVAVANLTGASRPIYHTPSCYSIARYTTSVGIKGRIVHVFSWSSHEVHKQFHRNRTLTRSVHICFRCYNAPTGSRWAHQHAPNHCHPTRSINQDGFLER